MNSKNALTPGRYYLNRNGQIIQGTFDVIRKITKRRGLKTFTQIFIHTLKSDSKLNLSCPTIAIKFRAGGVKPGDDRNRRIAQIRAAKRLNFFITTTFVLYFISII